MTNFQIFFIVILVFPSLFLDDAGLSIYSIHPRNEGFYKEEDLQNKSQTKLNQQVHNGNNKCGYTQS